MTSAEKQRKIEIDQLGASLEIVYTAFCIYCSNSEDGNQTEKEFATRLHDKGWRVSDMGDVCCPQCAKTH